MNNKMVKFGMNKVKGDSYIKFGKKTTSIEPSDEKEHMRLMWVRMGTLLYIFDQQLYESFKLIDVKREDTLEGIDKRVQEHFFENLGTMYVWFLDTMFKLIKGQGGKTLRFMVYFKDIFMGTDFYYFHIIMWYKNIQHGHVLDGTQMSEIRECMPDGEYLYDDLYLTLPSIASELGDFDFLRSMMCDDHGFYTCGTSWLSKPPILIAINTCNLELLEIIKNKSIGVDTMKAYKEFAIHSEDKAVIEFFEQL